MSGPEFFQTVMGHRFYERDVPKIAEALSEIAKVAPAIPALVKLLEQQAAPLIAVKDVNEDQARADGDALNRLAEMLRDRTVSLRDIIELVKSTGRNVL